MVQHIYDSLPGRENEIWVRLTCDPNIKNMYNISNYGRIKNDKGVILKPDLDKDGYLKFTLQSIHGKKIKRFSHRLVGMQFIPNLDNKPEINHKRVVVINGRNICPHDDNYYCNLEWVSRKENIKHSLENSLERSQPRCDEAYRSKFDNDTVHFICLLMEHGYTNSQILSALGFKSKHDKNYESFRGLIKHIRSRKTWKDITKLYNF